MLSTECCAATTEMCWRTTGQVTKKPLVVHECNYSMNRVDKADQYIVYYSFVQKSKKWWRKFFFWLFETAVVNSYILYRTTTPSPSTHLHYRRSVIDALATRHLSDAPPRPHAGHPRVAPVFPTAGNPDRLNKQQHFLGRREMQDCVVCSNHATEERHRSKLFCTTCRSYSRLCPNVCFERYHTLNNFKL